jgi:hypothetical protein
MPELAFTRLPVDPDEGFPQSFLLGLGGRTYGFSWYVNVPEVTLLGDRRPHDPRVRLDLVGDPTEPDGPAGILVLIVDRRDPDGVVPLLRRRVLPGLVYDARDLWVRVDTIGIAVGNLNGAGSYGSVLDVQVADGEVAA